MAWRDLVAVSVNIELTFYGEDVSYSRPVSPRFVAVPVFTAKAWIDTGGEYASPTGPLFAAVFVRLSDIPLGPQKGDLVATLSPSPLAGRSYRVEEIFPNVNENHAILKVRWTGL